MSRLLSIVVTVALCILPLVNSDQHVNRTGTNSLENLVTQFTRGGQTIFVIDWARSNPVEWSRIRTPTIFFDWRSIPRLRHVMPKSATVYLFLIDHNCRLEKIHKFMKTNRPQISELIIVSLGRNRHRYSFNRSPYILLINYRRKTSKMWVGKITKSIHDSVKLKILIKKSTPIPTTHYNKINIFLYNLYQINMRIGSIIILATYLVLWVVYELIYNRFVIEQPSRHRLGPMNIFLIIFAVHHGLPYRFQIKLKLFQQFIFASLLVYVIVIYGLYAQTVIHKIFIDCNVDKSCRENELKFDYRYVDTTTVLVSCSRFCRNEVTMDNLTTLLFNRYVDCGLVQHEIERTNRLRNNDGHKALKVVTVDDLEILFYYLAGCLLGATLVFCGEIIISKWQRRKFKCFKKMTMCKC